DALGERRLHPLARARLSVHSSSEVGVVVAGVGGGQALERVVAEHSLVPRLGERPEEERGPAVTDAGFHQVTLEGEAPLGEEVAVTPLAPRIRREHAPRTDPTNEVAQLARELVVEA